MSEQIEIEFKTMLTKEEYAQLLTRFNKTLEDAYTQTNYYFDTSDYALQKLGCGLRIRRFEEAGEQTLKSPLPIGLLETTDELTLVELEELVRMQQIKSAGAVATKLRELGIDSTKTTLFADLTTNRIDITLPQGLLAIDESWYSDEHDYELELEVVAENAHESIFLDLLNEWDITFKPSQNKIKRAKAAFDQKQLKE